jgi:hypothetical protein
MSVSNGGVQGVGFTLTPSTHTLIRATANSYTCSHAELGSLRHFSIYLPFSNLLSQNTGIARDITRIDFDWV